MLNLEIFDNPWESKNKASQNKKSDNEPSAIHDAEELVRKSKEKIIGMISKNTGGSNGSEHCKLKSGDNGGYKMFGVRKLFVVGIVALVMAWLATGFYTVGPDEAGVVTKFGKYNRISTSGLNYKLPVPIEMVEKISVTRMNKEFIGTKFVEKLLPTASQPGNAQQDESELTIPEESQMLTADGNIIEMHFFVQWRIKDPRDYLFNIKDEYGASTVRASAESAVRQVVGVEKLYDALSEQRQGIEQKARKILQDTLDSYGSGIEITNLGILYSYVAAEVRDAYRDVQSAKADKERLINEAYSYRNDIIPRARGEAQSLLEEAKAYRESAILSAQGEVERFNKVFVQYQKAKDVTRKRIYIETMESVLKNIDKIIIDDSTHARPILPLSDILAKKGRVSDAANATTNK
ncbi:modulator of FtsH protease HflK [Alphaproteobacteria bacterium]